LGEVVTSWSQLRIPLRLPEGMPNLAEQPSIRITDRAAIIRRAREAAGEAELVVRRWSWPGAGGKPVYNFRSDGRTLGESATGGRCLIPVSGFYEFTAPPDGSAKKAPKSKWAFEAAGLDWFCIAGLWRTDAAVGEAWTMLTCEPGPDVAPYHHRQVVVLTPPDYARWLDPAVPAAELCHPAPAGTLTVRQER
jgi:putative SOS response-associated peptidase YedK